MKPEMSNAEAITRIDRFLAYLEEIWTPQCDCEEALIRRDDITAFVIARDALKEARPHGEWKVDNKIYCSECGESICDFIPNPTDAVGLILSNNFCFNCGADMRKEGEAE